MSPADQRLPHALDVLPQGGALLLAEAVGLVHAMWSASVSTDVIAVDRAAGVANSDGSRFEEHREDAAALRNARRRGSTKDGCG